MRTGIGFTYGLASCHFPIIIRTGNVYIFAALTTVWKHAKNKVSSEAEAGAYKFGAWQFSIEKKKKILGRFRPEEEHSSMFHAWLPKFS